MKRDAAYARELLAIIADELNVKKIYIGSMLAYEQPPISPRQQKQLEQFETIYGGQQ